MARAHTVKENLRRRPMEGGLGGLGRQGAVKKRKGEVHEMNGHQFVKRQFFQVILCALCNKFLVTGDGYQCDDCRYMCHEHCYTKVLTKCISKPNVEAGEGDEDKINHNIPHRFEPYSNLSPNWCCHCGFLLPLGRKIPRKCTGPCLPSRRRWWRRVRLELTRSASPPPSLSPPPPATFLECSLTCHEHCAHLVPNFCGISPEKANLILGMVRDVNKQKKAAPSPAAKRTQQQQQQQQQLAGPPPSPSHHQHQHHLQQQHALAHPGQQQQLAPQLDRLHLDGQTPRPAPPPPSPQFGREVDHHQPQQQQQPYRPQQPQPQHQRQPSRDRPLPQTPGRPVEHAPAAGAAAHAHAPPYQQPQQQQQRQQQPGPPQRPYDPYGSAAPPPPSSHQQQARPLPPPAMTTPSTTQPMVAPPLQQQQRVPPPPPPSPGQHQQHPHQQQRPSPPVVPQQQQQPPAAVVVAAASPRPPSAVRRGKIGLEDFNFLTVLGKGNFGKVMLAEEKTSTKLYAIKVLKKEFIIENDEVDSTKSEKQVFLAAADNQRGHPFLLNLHSCFQTETRIYFVMEYISGGDLMLHIQRKQFSVRQAKFYACEVLLALEYFHAKGIIYRSVPPPPRFSTRPPSL